MIGLGDRQIVARPARLCAEPFETEHRNALQAFGYMQEPSAAEIELSRGDVRAVLGRIVGQPKERLAHLRRGCVAQRAMPAIETRQPF